MRWFSPVCTIKGLQKIEEEKLSHSLSTIIPGVTHALSITTTTPFLLSHSTERVVILSWYSHQDPGKHSYPPNKVILQHLTLNIIIHLIQVPLTDTITPSMQTYIYIYILIYIYLFLPLTTVYVVHMYLTKLTPQI